jgi:hypothetical protein
MKRQLIAVGLAVFALMVLAYISAAVAAPQDTPLLQDDPHEPNDDFDQATTLNIPASLTGKIKPADDLDYFSMSTELGREYEASLAIWNNEGMQLIMTLYNADEEYVKSSSASASSTNMSWIANQDLHYIRVEAASVVITKTADYRLDVNRVAATLTPTPTPTPTPQNNWDAYEPNDSLDNPSDVSIGATLANLNFWPYDTYTEEEANAADDLDVFRVWCKPGHTCRAKTAVTTGVDTIVKVYAGGATNPSEPTIAENDDYGETLGSQVTWQSSGSGYYKIWIDNLDRSPRQSTGQTYNLTLTDLAATPTPTPGPTETPEPGATAIPGIDQFEPNYDFAHATTIGTGITYQANFIPWGGAEEDNDYYKTWIKPGLHFVCETLDLAPGVDTNMIVYDGNQNAIGGNDDAGLGDYRSRFAYFSTYEGWLYILVGHGGRLPATELEDSNYKLKCDMQIPGQPTATNIPGPTPTPKPTTTAETPTPSESPITTPTPSEGLTVRPLTTPTPVPVTTPAPRFIPITLLVYYDANNDRQPGAGEGITGISAQAYEVATNQLLAQGFTDERGNLEFTVASSGPVRVSVPFFGFSQLVAGEGASIYVRVPPQQLPRGTP